eukprot:6077546-Prymnesium_polylepis.1
MHLASLIEWILTTIDGFERDDCDPLNTGVRQSAYGVIWRNGGYGVTGDVIWRSSSPASRKR